MRSDGSSIDHRLFEQLLKNATFLAKADNARLLSFNPAKSRLECIYGSSCTTCSVGTTADCTFQISELPSNVQKLLYPGNSIEYIAARLAIPPSSGDRFPTCGTQILMPLQDFAQNPCGLLVFETPRSGAINEKDLRDAKSVSRLCALALQKSRLVENRDRMIAKLKLLSEASDVLLAEFQDRPLPEKLDYIVRKAVWILDAEVCSVWLARGSLLTLETGFSQKLGKRIDRKITVEIKEGPEYSITGHIAFKKELFNLSGEILENLRQKAKKYEADFTESLENLSELAYPILKEESPPDGGKKELIGLLIAYNKLDRAGQPMPHTGFSEDFDEPLIKILATKIAISLRNAELLKNLRSYRTIVESTPDPVMISALTGEIVYMNPGAVSLFGNLLGAHVADWYPADKSASGMARAREIKTLIKRARDKRLKNYETNFLSKDGTPIPFSLSASLLYDEKGNEAGVIGIAKDLRRSKALSEIGQALIQIHDREEILNQIVQVGLGLHDSVRAYIKLYDAKTDTLAFSALKSRRNEEASPPAATPADQGMTGFVFHSQASYLSNDVQNETLFTYNKLFSDVRSKIVVPITSMEQETGIAHRWGVLSVDSEAAYAFSTSDQYYLENLASYTAVALENASLIDSKNKHIARLRAIERVQQAASEKDFTVTQIYDVLLEAVVDLLGFEYATISEVDLAQQQIGTVRIRNVPEEFLSASWHPLESKDIQAWVARHKEHVCLDGWDERLDRDIFEKYEHDKLVRVILPIITRDQVLGTLETGYAKAHRESIDKEEIQTLQRLLNLAGVGISQHNLLEDLRNDIRLRTNLENQLDALNDASLQILNSSSAAEAIDHIFKSLENIGYDRVMLSLIDHGKKQIVGKYALGENWRKICSRAVFDLKGNNLLAYALRSKSPQISKTCFQDSRWSKKLAREAGITSQYIIPLIVKDEPIGALQIDLSDRQEMVHGDAVEFSRRMKVLETFASQCAIAIRNIQHTFTIDRLEANIAETAHEFRGPLHIIMTQLGGLRDFLATKYGSDQARIDQFLNIINEEIYRAKRQVDNSLLLSERTLESMEYDFQKGKIQSIITDCEDACKLRALERGIKIIVRDNVKSLPVFRFDHDKMSQVITNLLDNAIKYSHYNQYIDIIGFDDGSRINIQVVDRGMGIPEKEYGSIFEGFMRSEAKDKIRFIPGTGLGLKICKELVEGHRGEISVLSTPMSKNPQKIKEFQDYKTTFWIKIPKNLRSNRS